MEKYAPDFTRTLRFMSNKNNAVELIEAQSLRLPSGHINIRACFGLFGLEDKYYWIRLNRHFRRLRVSRDEFRHIRIQRSQHLLIPDHIALDIVCHTANGLLVYGRGVNDYRGRGDSDTTLMPAYFPWKSMLERCYCPLWHERKPQYINHEVCEDWLTFSVFNDWYNANLPSGAKHRTDIEYVLHKNIYANATRYAADTCFLLPKPLHTLISNYSENRSELPVGVRKIKGSVRYGVSIKIDGKRVSLGVYDTAEEAAHVYQEARWHVISVWTKYYLKNRLVTPEFSHSCEAKLNEIGSAQSISEKLKHTKLLHFLLSLEAF